MTILEYLDVAPDKRYACWFCSSPKSMCFFRAGRDKAHPSGFYHCHACLAKGTGAHLLMEMQSITYRQALRTLAIDDHKPDLSRQVAHKRLRRHHDAVRAHCLRLSVFGPVALYEPSEAHSAWERGRDGLYMAREMPIYEERCEPTARVVAKAEAYYV